MVLGLTVGGWFAAAIVTKLITALLSYAKDQSKIQLGLKNELQRLEKALPKIQAVVDAVDRGDIKDENPALHQWLWELKDAADEVEDMMDELEYNQIKEELEAGRSKVSNATSRFKTIINRAMHRDHILKGIKKLVSRLDEVAAGVGVFFELVNNLKKKKKLLHHQPGLTRHTSSLLTVETQVFGRDNEKEEVISKLLNFTNSKSMKRCFSILPIVGVGGVGKTTLAQFVYNDKRIEQHFDIRMWVHVSNVFDLISLTKKMYESAFKRPANFDNFDEPQRKLSEKLMSKRFLLVLDDAWNDDDRIGWDNLLAPLMLGERGSMILLTTRMETVGKMMMHAMEPFFLNGLSGDDYWALFKECAFRDEDPNYHKKLQGTGRRIAEKLKGSPLAAKTVGGILSSDLDDKHWENVLNSDIWELEQGKNDIIPALRISYQHLSSHLKPCFTLCGIFPQDHEFDKDDLVYMWMALGLVQQDGSIRPEDVGCKYFDDLVKKSFFDRKIGHGRTYYVMHDLLQDLAQFVSQGECLRVVGDKPETLPSSLRHLSIDSRDQFKVEFSDLKNLRTLLLYSGEIYTEQSFVNMEMLKGLKSLRILRLPPNCKAKISDCIGYFIHLRYLSLDLTAFSHASEFLNRLYHLQVLRFTSAEDDGKNERNSFSNLINLRHLIMPGNSVANISGIGRLTSLQDIELFCSKAEDRQKISDLRDLRELRQLSIQNLENVISLKEVAEANMKDKNCLQKLSLKWNKDGSPTFDEQVFDNLEPHSSLKVLTISGYMGRRLPCWMTTRSLSQLESISLLGCKEWENISPLEQLPFLKYLHVELMLAIKRVNCQSSGSTMISLFPSLQVLEVSSCLSIEEWYGGAGATQWSTCLRRLSILICPKMKVLAPLPSSLRELDIGHVALDVLPKLQPCPKEYNYESSLTSVSLVSIKIDSCSMLTSLAEGLLLHPEHFTALEDLTILNCRELMHLPVEGFRRLTSLKKLVIEDCPKLQRSESFLPRSLQSLTMVSCGYLDAALPKALEDLILISKIELRNCANITSLPSIKVLARWKALRSLSIDDCRELASVEGLQAIFSLKHLKIRGCTKLVAVAAASVVENSSSLEKLKLKESTADGEKDPFEQPLLLDELDIDDLSLVCKGPLQNLPARDVKSYIVLNSHPCHQNGYH